MSWDFAEALAGEGYGGTAALLITDLAGRELYSLGADRPFPAASTIQVPLLVLALRRAQAGALNLTQRVVLRAEDRAPGAGVLHELGPGLALSWRDVLTLMTVVSDNTATNLLIEQLGVEAINSGFKELGLEHTRLVGALQRPPERQNAAQRRGERNSTSARDQGWLLCELKRGTLLNGAGTALALDLLERQHLRDLIGRSVPHGRGGQPLYRVASKSGELPGIHHDVGLIYTPRPLIVALLSEGGLDPREHPANRDVTLLSAGLWPLLASLGKVHEAPSLGDI